jgi:hypothetical protein
MAEVDQRSSRLAREAEHISESYGCDRTRAAERVDEFTSRPLTTEAIERCRASFRVASGQPSPGTAA